MLTVLRSTVPVIVIWTNPTQDPPDWLRDRATIITDTAKPMNIQRWWNKGIKQADTDVVVVANDDLLWSRDTSTQMANGLNGRTLAMVQGYPMTGWLWALDRRHGVLPDEGYQWYFGDNQLIFDAIQYGQNMAWVPAHVRHLKFRRDDAPEVTPLIDKDWDRWEAKHGVVRGRRVQHGRR